LSGEESRKKKITRSRERPDRVGAGAKAEKCPRQRALYFSLDIKSAALYYVALGLD
jgi:hypothetical protein